ncbi:hypothetical protein E3C22_20255 [Jiella endophytica]|uniref:Uncharacterized protein n=1 Tax=Jiella endophytica TaxID=2558362 RepID=A0A4Y8RDM6_9HYPH|nr:hypothetical protein [Jiella endophytica]TFF19107.1 hypothetical protein E3C22_20255 [Jiella endophytica]
MRIFRRKTHHKSLQCRNQLFISGDFERSNDPHHVGHSGEMLSMPRWTLRLLLVAPAITGIFAMAHPAASAALSLEMFTERSLQALTEFYRAEGGSADVACRSARLEGERGQLAIACVVDGQASPPLVWLADTIGGEIVTLAPLSPAAVSAAERSPRYRSGKPPLKYVTFEALPAAERSRALARAETALTQ